MYPKEIKKISNLFIYFNIEERYVDFYFDLSHSFNILDISDFLELDSF